MATFGETLKEKRRAAKLSQRQLAERAGVDFSYISKLENDRVAAPAADTVVRLAECLGCPAEDLLAAARKMPTDSSDAVSGSPAALRFLHAASQMRLTADEWERMLGQLHGLRSDGDEEVTR